MANTAKQQPPIGITPPDEMIERTFVHADEVGEIDPEAFFATRQDERPWLPIDPAAPDAGWMAGVVEVRSQGNAPVHAAVTRTRMHAHGAWVTGNVWYGMAGKLMFTPTEWRPL